MGKDNTLIENIIKILRQETKKDSSLIDLIIEEYGQSPYLILIACLLSLRAKDAITIHTCQTLFNKVKTPKKLISLPIKELEKIIFKGGFYKQKAKMLHEVSKILLTKYDGTVPNEISELLRIKGIGRKTANLVLGKAFNIPSICVDIHVHRISNRLGIIKTKTSEETEKELAKIIPKKYCIEWNNLLVIWGQKKCTPRNPKCSRCALKSICHRNIPVKLLHQA
jgi:endonuclease III